MNPFKHQIHTNSPIDAAVVQQILYSGSISAPDTIRLQTCQTIPLQFIFYLTFFLHRWKKESQRSQCWWMHAVKLWLRNVRCLSREHQNLWARKAETTPAKKTQSASLLLRYVHVQFLWFSCHFSHYWVLFHVQATDVPEYEFDLQADEKETRENKDDIITETFPCYKPAPDVVEPVGEDGSFTCSCLFLNIFLNS